jgi:hypothetical protein
LSRLRIAELAVEVSRVIPDVVGDKVITLPPVPLVAVNSEWELVTPWVVAIVAEPEIERPGKTVPRYRGAVAA